MAPPPNLRRRRALADGAIEVLARDGVHGLSHRAVDEAAGVPAGTASNYFRSRDALLQAVTERILELHRADMEASTAVFPGPVDRDGLAALLAASLEHCATVHRSRYLAACALTLEAARRPALQRALDAMQARAVDYALAHHRLVGLATTREDVETLTTMFSGALFTLLTGTAGPDIGTAARTLARALVDGIRSAVPLAAVGTEQRPGAGGPRSAAS
ncbi:TetR/AcrR family transcriptional regulator [Allostreptomyces psammosilenae]|uniref:DNA-binding transcriptional regulator YbjK n=1 Tax=Allostreptomyces psammosilenae TaxID=1892865 RepID=A0A853A1I7_9ACTN|nr:TetR family transcriptional regulator [Allostreptomyces psammosilenae]NYI04661.1 DNA-binding transcriptional regulator YbjK [Allostreptomyces psammosilenae]